MQRAIDEVNRRRAIQEHYNREHGITPQSATRAIRDDRLGGKKEEQPAGPSAADIAAHLSGDEYEHLLHDLNNQMALAAQSLEFEQAARLRDQITALTEARIGRMHKQKRTRRRR